MSVIPLLASTIGDRNSQTPSRHSSQSVVLFSGRYFARPVGTVRLSGSPDLSLHALSASTHAGRTLPENLKEPNMKKSLFRLVLVSVAAVAVTLLSPQLQAQYVYVNDNNAGSGLNTATGFVAVAGPALAIVTGSPFATTSTGYASFPAPNQQVAISYSSTQNCLFVSDPLGNTAFPTGDFAAFTINPGNGSLTLVGNFNDPSNTSGANKLLPLAIDRRLGFVYLFAAFTGEGKIAFYKINTSTCQAFWSTSTTAVGLSGSPVMSMAVSKAGPHVLVVSYGDGSIQSFKIGGGTLTPLLIFNSTGFTNQSGRPMSVDITKNGKYAVFGDAQPGVAEVEVAKILSPSGNLAPTIDYGGPASASGLNLAPGIDSQDVWLSPGIVLGNFYLYITNNGSGQVTTARINQTTGIVSNAGTCTAGFTNPTTLNPLSWTRAAGLHTLKTTGAGVGLAVGENGTPSSVALLAIQNASGCTKETSASPFIDPNSNFTFTGLESVDVFPSRPY
jgi:hypothetical protein